VIVIPIGKKTQGETTSAYKDLKEGSGEWCKRALCEGPARRSIKAAGEEKMNCSKMNLGKQGEFSGPNVVNPRNISGM